MFNEESNIEPLHSALLPIMDQLSERYEFELLFTDNYSTDRTFDALEQLAQRDVRGRIYPQVKKRPLTIVERELNPVGTRPDSLTFTAPRAR